MGTEHCAGIFLPPALLVWCQLSLALSMANMAELQSPHSFCPCCRVSARHVSPFDPLQKGGIFRPNSFWLSPSHHHNTNPTKVCVTYPVWVALVTSRISFLSHGLLPQNCSAFKLLTPFPALAGECRTWVLEMELVSVYESSIELGQWRSC